MRKTILSLSVVALCASLASAASLRTPLTSPEAPASTRAQASVERMSVAEIKAWVDALEKGSPHLNKEGSPVLYAELAPFGFNNCFQDCRAEAMCFSIPDVE